MANVLNVPNMASLNALQNHDEGEVAFVEETKSYMIYHNDMWLPVEAQMTDDGLQLNLYDLNKQVVSQLPPFDEQRIQDAIDTLTSWKQADTYLLYGREIGYFTLLTQSSEDNHYDYAFFGEGIIALLHDITDKIYAIDVMDENTIEIWIDYQGNSTVLYLFDYTNGMVTYGR